MKSHPRFSVVVPTRERCETLRHCMRTILNQSCEDFELVIMDNRSADQTQDIVSSFDDERIQYFCSDVRLSMRDNWELALSHIRGQYTIYIGDDDGLMPNGLDFASKIIDHFTNVKAIKWRSGCNYWWPDVLVKGNENLLFVNFGNQFRLIDSHKKLLDYYKRPSDEHTLPMIYHGIVETNLIRTIVAKYGGYFMAVGCDVFSGLVNAYHIDSYILSDMPLSVVGVGGKSNGAAHLFRGKTGEDIRKLQGEEMGVQNQNELLHPELRGTGSHNPHLFTGDCLLRFRDQCKLDPTIFCMDKLYLLNAMTYTVRFDPDGYEQTVNNIKNLARIWEIPESMIKFPPKQERRRPHPGPQFTPNGELATLVIDGDLAGISNVYDAVNLANAITYKSIHFSNQSPTSQVENETSVPTPETAQSYTTYDPLG